MCKRSIKESAFAIMGILRKEVRGKCFIGCSFFYFSHRLIDRRGAGYLTGRLFDQSRSPGSATRNSSLSWVLPLSDVLYSFILSNDHQGFGPVDGGFEPLGPRVRDHTGDHWAIIGLFWRFSEYAASGYQPPSVRTGEPFLYILLGYLGVSIMTKRWTETGPSCSGGCSGINT